MRAFDELTHLVQFSSGHPAGDLAWTLLNGIGSTVATGSVSPVEDAVSAIITINGDDNGLDVDQLSTSRELRWTYEVDGIVVIDSFRYRVEAFLPFGVSPEGVRRKLGLETHEITDDEVNLTIAYGEFQALVGENALEAMADESGYAELVIANAIEALAALRLLPSLQIRVAKKESSGTNQFERQTVDWDALRASLEQAVEAGALIIAPELDPTLNLGAIFVTVVRGDPVVGEGT